MKMIKPGKSIYEVVSDTNYFLLKIIIVKNLCVVVNSFHEANLVCGNFNPRNIIFDIEIGYGNLIDMDLFYFIDKKQARNIDVQLLFQNIWHPKLTNL